MRSIPIARSIHPVESIHFPVRFVVQNSPKCRPLSRQRDAANRQSRASGRWTHYIKKLGPSTTKIVRKETRNGHLPGTVEAAAGSESRMGRLLEVPRLRELLVYGVVAFVAIMSWESQDYMKRSAAHQLTCKEASLESWLIHTKPLPSSLLPPKSR